MNTPRAERLAAFRRELAARGLDGFVVPLTDAHASEYVAERDRCLAWLTGFAGSAGSAIVLADKAAVFVDGRYVLQVEAQVDGALFERIHTADQEPLAWLATRAGKDMRIGYDPSLHTVGQVEHLQRALARSGAEAVAVPDSPFDIVWTDRPRPSSAPARPHPVDFAGMSAADKRQEIADALAAAGARTAVLTALDAIAWAFNIRGEDVAHTPVALAYALVRADRTATLFIAPEKVTDALRAHLGNGVTLAPYDAFYDALGDVEGPVLADPASANAAVFGSLDAAGVRIVREADPCALMKARKNPVEIAGTRAAHIRDGAAVTRFLHWLDGAAPGGGLDEIAAAERLAQFRKGGTHHVGPSFDTISGAGPNGAIVHYRVSPETSRPLRPGELYLVDSGAQYLDGTTDITRTVPVGDVGEEERRNFTRVLKGHIALATLRFPKGTTGAQIDALARRPLWDAGLDYDHGTGHGVGSFLAVHEGPQRIAKIPNRVALVPGMIVSNEPGFYKTGGYGIRIENLVMVCEDEASGERPFRRFETLTLAPIDRRLVIPSMLSDAERAWLDAYHARVRETLTPLVPAATAAWLATMTAPLDGG